MTPTEIIDEIKRLTPYEQAQVAQSMQNLKRQLTPDELAELTRRIINEKDPERLKALKQEFVEGFYGDDTPDA